MSYPTPPKNFTKEQKHHHKVLYDLLVLENLWQPRWKIALELYARDAAILDRVTSDINEQTGIEGHIQTYDSGSTNVSAEHSIYAGATKRVREHLQSFGLTPVDHKKLHGKPLTSDARNSVKDFKMKKLG